MFDYQYGTPTKKFKQEVEKMRAKLSVEPNQQSKVLTLIMKCMHGLDILTLSLVSRLWYKASWSSDLWEYFCRGLSENSKIEVLAELAESKIKTFERKSKKAQDLSDLVQSSSKQALKWKLIYGQLLYNTCYSCKIQEGKLRFLSILQQSLCFLCAKKPLYSMISLENAELDYGVTRKQINDYQLEGLRIPDPNQTGKFMFVYYVEHILRLKRLADSKKTEGGQDKTEFKERRRTELIYCMKKEGFDDAFIGICLDSVGSLAYNYILGKSKMNAIKIANKMRAKYEKWREVDQEDEVLLEPEAILPLKRPQVHLSPEEKTKRKIELVERLLIMGVNSNDIGLDETDSIATAFIEGRTKEDLGPVAGAIWREHKPVFAGYAFNKSSYMEVESSNSEVEQ